MDNQTVKKVYKRFAPFYDYFFGPLFAQGRSKAVKMINQRLAPESKILEVGVGTGRSLPKYKNQFQIIGIDLSSEMLQEARRLSEKHKLDQVKDLLIMDAQELTFEDNTYDAVVAMHVVSVVPDLEKFLKEVTRVCKPGGDLVILNHFRSEKGIVRKLKKWFSKLDKYIGFYSDFSGEVLFNHPDLELKFQQKVNLFGCMDLLHFKIQSREKTATFKDQIPITDRYNQKG